MRATLPWEISFTHPPFLGRPVASGSHMCLYKSLPSFPEVGATLARFHLKLHTYPDRFHPLSFSVLLLQGFSESYSINYMHLDYFFPIFLATQTKSFVTLPSSPPHQYLGLYIHRRQLSKIYVCYGNMCQRNGKSHFNLHRQELGE